MKTTILLLAALSGILHAQGPLAPPAGPAPTMKSLDQIEPRTPISRLPYTISQPGSYYFTGNLQHTAASGSAIFISASNVTLDLMGFTLSSTSSVTGNGIMCNDSALKGITIKNGSIVGNTSVTQSGDPATWTPSPAGFNSGISNNSSQASFINLSLSGARTDGLKAGSYATVERVHSSSNGAEGISASASIITNSTATGNGGRGIFAIRGSVSHSNSSSNGGIGIASEFGSVTNVTVFANGGNGISATLGSVTNSVAYSNGGSGIVASNGTVTSSMSYENSGDGISVFWGSVTDSAASNNGADGIVASYSTVTNSTARGNRDKGISAYSGSVTGCSATENATNGIYASLGSITNSTATANTQADISASNAVVAFCRFTTFGLSGTSRTGNFPSP